MGGKIRQPDPSRKRGGSEGIRAQKAYLGGRYLFHKQSSVASSHSEGEPWSGTSERPRYNYLASTRGLEDAWSRSRRVLIKGLPYSPCSAVFCRDCDCAASKSYALYYLMADNEKNDRLACECDCWQLSYVLNADWWWSPCRKHWHVCSTAHTTYWAHAVGHIEWSRSFFHIRAFYSR